MPNGSSNSITLNFKSKEEWIDEEDILRAYAFREEHGTDVTDNIHPLLIDKRLRHVPKAELAKFQNILFKMRYDQLKGDNAKILPEYPFVGIDGTVNGKTAVFVVEDYDTLRGVLDKFKKTKVSIFDKFTQEEALKLVEEGSRDFLGIGDERIFYNGRDYSMEMIGTKGTFNLENVDEGTSELSFLCLTAGSPPEPFLQTLATDFGLKVELSADIEGEDGIHAQDCLDEWDKNGGCKYDYDVDTCAPDYYEETFYPEEE